MFITIKRFWPVRSLIPIESIFLWLAQLSQLISPSTNRLYRIESKKPFVSLLTNPNCIESKSLLISPITNPNYTKSKSLSNNCCKTNGAKSKRMGSKKVKRNDSESLE